MSRTSKSGPERYLSVSAAAAYSSLSISTIRRMLRDGRLHPYRPLKRRVLIDREELDNVIRKGN